MVNDNQLNRTLILLYHHKKFQSCGKTHFKECKSQVKITTNLRHFTVRCLNTQFPSLKLSCPAS